MADQEQQDLKLFLNPLHKVFSLIHYYEGTYTSLCIMLYKTLRKLNTPLPHIQTILNANTECQSSLADIMFMYLFTILLLRKTVLKLEQINICKFCYTKEIRYFNINLHAIIGHFSQDGHSAQCIFDNAKVIFSYITLTGYI